MLCLFFTTCLVIEVAFTLYGTRCQCSRRNIFDCLVVGGQVANQVLVSMPPSGNTSMVVACSVTYIARVMCLLRVFRIFGVASFIPLARELRMLTISAASSLRSLCSSLIVLSIIVWILGTCLTESVTKYKIEHGHGMSMDLESYFGSVDRSMLSLYQAISNGISWELLSDPLNNHISPWLSLILCLYVGLCMMALQNIITGVFVATAIRDAEEDQKDLLVNLMKHLFIEGDVDGSGRISFEEFINTLKKPDVAPLLKAIGMNYADAVQLFRLLDTDASGEIDPGELISGCVRLQGHVKAVDFAAFLYDFWSIVGEYPKHVAKLSKIGARLDELTEILVHMNKANP